MNGDAIDRAMTRDASIEPSAGFADRVMEAVHREAATPPIPFPWRRFGFGLAACAAAGAVVLGAPAIGGWIGEAAFRSFAGAKLFHGAVATGLTVVIVVRGSLALTDAR